MGTLMISCKKAGELIEKRSIEKLGLMERIQLSAHIGMCNLCAHYEKISQLLDLKLKECENTKTEVDKILPDSIKVKILNSTTK